MHSFMQELKEMSEGVYHLENTTSRIPASSPQSFMPVNPGKLAERTLREERRRANSETDLLREENEEISNRVISSQLPPRSRSTIGQMVDLPFNKQGNINVAGGHLGELSRAKSQQSENNVKVVVRLRPPISEDTENLFLGEFKPCVYISDNKSTVQLRRPAFDKRDFTFDHIIPSSAGQGEAYEVVAEDIVNDVLRGYNGTILTYGQTGSGKTFTVFGPMPEDWEPFRGYKSAIEEPNSWLSDARRGIIPRSIAHVFSHIENNRDTTEFRVTVNFMQIYMENVMDLLDSTKTNLTIREDPKQGIFVDGLSQLAVENPMDLLDILVMGAQNRYLTKTNMNKVSSRSHVILMMTIEQRERNARELTSRTSDQRVKRGVLTLVDLAGSERVSKSLSEGQRLEEAKNINRSLSALGNCVAALIDSNTTHVPFRDSKLTRLLTDSLGGNSKTCLCATIGPAAANYEESNSTLLFATRAMAVKNHAVINEVVDFKTLTGTLQRKISLMEGEKSRLVAKTIALEREVASLKKEIEELKAGYRPPMQELSAGQYTPISTPQYTSQDDTVTRETTWEQRERELVVKFTSIIQHLQMEIAKQRYATTRQTSPVPVSRENTGGDGDAIVEQLVSSFVNIPALKTKLFEKLGLGGPEV